MRADGITSTELVSEGQAQRIGRFRIIRV